MPSRLGNVPSCGYTRARAESLGGKLKGVGIGERAERLLIIAIIGMIPMREAMQWAMIIVSIVAGITLGSESGGNCKEIVFYRKLVAVRLSASDLTFTMPL